MRKFRVNKVLCCTLALFMAATVDNGYTVGNLFKGLQASAQTVSDSLQASDDASNVLKYDNKIQSDYGTRYIVKVSRNADFPDGYGAYIEEMSKEDTQECVDYLNEKLSDSKQEVADYIHPVDISVTNETNENASDLGSMVVRVYMEDTEGLEDYTLYHFKDDDAEEVDFTTGTDETRTECASYVEFSTDSFSPFLFVKTQVKLESSSKNDSKKEKSNEEDVKNDDEIVTDENIDEDASSDTNEVKENTPSVASNSTSNIYFNTLTTKLFKGADQNSDGTYTWTPSNPTKGHRFALRVSYSISGVGEAKAGQLTMTVPKSVIKDRTGKSADEIEFSIPTKEDVDAYLAGSDEGIDEDVNFAYYEDGDNVVIYNFRDVSAGENGYIELAYAMTKETFEYTSGEEYAFTCIGKVTDDNGNASSKSANATGFSMNSDATVTNVSVGDLTKYNSWSSSWGNTIKPSNDSDYVYLLYRFDVKNKATQRYNATINSTLTGNDSGQTNAMKILGYKFAGGSWSTSNTIKNQTKYSIDNEVSRYDYMLVAIKKSDMQASSYWKAVNDVSYVITPSDEGESTTEKTSKTWNWTHPVFVVPGGSASIFMRADGQYREMSATYSDQIFWYTSHYASTKSMKAGDYSRYDLESFNGYDGETITATELDGFDFASWINGYTYGLTYDIKNYQSDKKDENGYGKKNVDFELTTEGVYLFDSTKENESDDKTDMLTSSDYSIYKMDYSYYFRDAEFDEDELRFYSSDSVTYKNGESIDFYGKFGASTNEVKFASYNLKTGEIWYDSTYVASMTNETIVMNDSANMVGYTVKNSNTHYVSEIYTVPTVKLKNSTTVMNFVKNKKEIGIRLKNSGTIYSNQAGTKTVAATDEDTDCDYARTSKRNGELTKEVVAVSNNTKKKYYTLSWSVKAGEIATVGAGEQMYISQTTGTIFDLLPKGTSLDKSSIQISNGIDILNSSDYTVKTYENYNDTGRTMLVVKINKSGSYYKLLYDTIYSWDSINDYGDDVYNPVAYKTGNTSIADGYPDNGGKTDVNGNANEKAITDADKMTGLDEISGDSEKTGNTKKYLFAENTYDITSLTSASSGLKVKVKEERDKDYSSETATKINGSYSYRLRYQNSADTLSKDLILFDSLENYDRDTKKTTGTDSDWKGTLQSVDTSQLKELGIEPVVYISTVAGLDIEEHNDLSDSAIWTKVTKSTDLSKATAVAIDARKTKSGSDYVLGEKESIVAYLYMQAPEDAPTSEDGLPYTYNNVYISNTVTDSNERSYQSFLIHQDYTKVSLAVSATFGLRKVSSESAEQKVSDVTFNLSGTSSYGTKYNEDMITNSNGEIRFEDIEMGQYVLQETQTSDDWILDTTEHSVVINGKGQVLIDGINYTDAYITVTNVPRIHTNASFKSVDASYTTTTLENTQFRLYGTSDYGTTVNQYGTSNSKGTVSFKNIEKGTYELVETKTTDGYTLNRNVYQLVVDDGGNYTITLKTPSDVTKIDVLKSGKTYLIGNEPLHSVSFYKASSWDNSLLSEAKFTLTGTSDYGTKVNMEAFSDVNGQVKFTGLERGLYTLKETTAPSGYTINEKAYTVQVNTILAGESGDEYTIDGLSTNDKILGGKALIFYDSPESGTVSITKDWDDGEDDRDPSELNIILTTDKPSQYYASHSITFNANGGAFGNNTENNEVLYGVSKVGVIQTTISGTVLVPTKSGYKFDYWDKSSTAKSYWTTEKDGTGDKYYSIADDVYHVVDADGNIPTLKSDLVLYAQYEECSYVLETGSNFKNHIPSTATAVVFTDEEAPEDATLTDVSAKKNGNVVAWLDGTTWYVSSQTDGQKIELNTSCNQMFYNKTKLTSITFGDYVDTSKVTNMNSMFSSCSLLTSLNVSGFDTRSVTNMNSMFSSCSLLTSLDVSGFDTSSVTYMSYMFSGCSKLTSLDVSGFNTSNVTNMVSMFYGCNLLTTLDVSEFDTKNVTDMSSMFSDCNSLTSLDVSGFDTKNVTDMSYMFYNCSKLTTLNVSEFDTSKVTDMSYMFYNCSLLTSLNVSGFDTKNVTNMCCMFYGCNSLTTLDVSGFDTKNVTSMSSMFQACSKLTSLDVSGFDTKNVTNMSNMFSSCSSLTSLDVSGFDTKSVTNMSSMFYNCNSLTSLDVSGFDTKNVTSMLAMFRDCSSLTTLDVSGFDTKNVTDMQLVFYNCNSLTTIYAKSDWDTSSVTTSGGMFNLSYNLPNYSSSNTDATMAKLEENGGYFTFDTSWATAYSVKFDKNLTLATGTMSDESFAARESKALSVNKYVDSTGRYEFSGWNTKADGSGDSYSDGQSVQYLTKNSSITLYAQWKDTYVKYSHTANIDDIGTPSGTYANNLSTTDTVTISGATKLKVEIYISTESTSYDWLELRDSSGTKLTKDANGTTIGSSGKLGGGSSKTKPSTSQVFYISGDTVQFYFKSDSSSAYYGYYAIVSEAS